MLNNWQAKTCVLNAITAGQLITTLKIIQSSKSVLQSYKSAPFTQVDKFKLKSSSMTAQVASCTSDPGLNDLSFPFAKETNGENMSDVISDSHF